MKASFNPGLLTRRSRQAVFAAFNKSVETEINHRLALSLGQPPHPNLSDQQERVLQWVRQEDGSAVLIAVAGAGKTFTLIEVCKAIGGDVKAQTFHSIGLNAWQAVHGRVEVNGKKNQLLMDQLEAPKYLRGFVSKLVSLGKQAGVGCEVDGLFLDGRNDAVWLAIVEHYDVLEKVALDELAMSPQDVLEQGLFWTRKVIRESVKTSEKLVDYDDMIFEIIFRNIKLPKHPWVLLDEAQDTNAMRRELARRMLAPNGRLLAVGDPHQAIYGFTGADSESLAAIKETFACIELPLTVTYRCPKSVVRHAQQWVSHIQAHPSAPEGSVQRIQQRDFFDTFELVPGDAILCRVTKPLVELAFDLIKRGISCHVEGRKIGDGLIDLAKKWRRPRTIAQLRVKLEEYMKDEVARLMERGFETKAADLEDRVDTLLVIMSSLADDDHVSALHDKITSLFADTEGNYSPTVTLCTSHRAKGREWKRVFCWGPNRHMPSRFAKQRWQLIQEVNLMYVTATRAMETYVEVMVP